MSVEKLTFWLSLFAVLVLSTKSAEPNTTGISITKTLPPAVTNSGTNVTNYNQTNNETGSISNNEIFKAGEGGQNSTSNDLFPRYFTLNNGAVLRAFYVIVGVTVIVIIYFIVRSVRLRRKRSKTRKYGISGKNLDLEMTPLDQEEDDDDLTVFEAPKRIKR